MSPPNYPTQRTAVSTFGTSALAAMQQSSPSSRGLVWFNPILLFWEHGCVFSFWIFTLWVMLVTFV